MKIEVEEIHRLIVIALVCETMSKCACKKSSALGIQKRPHYKMQDLHREEIVLTIQKGVVDRPNTITMVEDNFTKRTDLKSKLLTRWMKITLRKIYYATRDVAI